MPACPSCRADVAEESTFCGECGTELEEAVRESESDPGEKLKNRVKEKREEENNLSWGKGIFSLLGAIVLIPLGYWLGFVGYTEMRMGVEASQGAGVYRLTYPVAGILFLLLGVIFLIGAAGNFIGAD